MGTNYGLLKGTMAEYLREDVAEDSSPHFQIVLLDEQQERYRIPVNVLSTQGPKAKREVLCHVDDGFYHPIIDRLVDLDCRLYEDPERHLRVDYARGAFVAREDMVKTPADLPGPTDDLQDVLEKYSRMAQLERAATDIYVWGEAWSDKLFPPDRLLGTTRGIHKVHRNQGRNEDVGGEFDDGMLLFHFRQRKQWVAFFVAFQNQTWYTTPDGRPSELSEEVAEIGPHIHIVGAMVNPPSGENEWLLLLNASNKVAQLAGWKLLDKEGREEQLTDVSVPPFNVARVVLSGRGARLPDAAGTIALIDPLGHPIDAVRYKKSERGRLVTFR